MIDWDKLIEERNVWVARNFPNARTPLDSFLGCIEELGELVYYLDQFCLIKGWDYENIVEDTWHTVSQRDWINNSIDGSAA
jgi:hypothetical protein